MLEPALGGLRLTNSNGSVRRLWALITGPSATRGLPEWQRKAVELARAAGRSAVPSASRVVPPSVAARRAPTVAAAARAAFGLWLCAASGCGEGSLRAVPVLYAADVARLSAFYERLGFRERFRLPAPDGAAGFVALRRGEAERGVTVEQAPRMLAGIEPGPGPRHELFVYVDDVDATVAQLRAEGTRVLREAADMQPRFGYWPNAAGGSRPTLALA